MAVSLRKQPGRTLLLVLAGTSLVLFFLNQSDLRAPFTTHPASLQAAGYSHRRIQDYSSPEYTAPGETGGDTALEAAREAPQKEDHAEGPLQREDQAEDVLRTPAIPTPSQDGILLLNKNHPQEQNDVIEENVKDAIPEETGSYDGDGDLDETGVVTGDEKVVEVPQAINENSNNDDASKADDRESPLSSAAAEAAAIDKDSEVGGREDEQAAKDPEGDLGAKTTSPVGTGTKDEDKKDAAAAASGGGKTRPNLWVNQLKPATKESLIENLISKQRDVLAQAMEGYSFHKKLKARHMDDLVLEKGGRPVRSVVITSWRSGSTFIGDVLQSHPATYYHYEPLLDFGISQVRSGKSAEQAVHNLRHLLTCNYTDMDHYLAYGPNHPWLFTHNTRLWYYCTTFPELCWDPDFLSPFCSLFPFQSLKTVRLRLNLTREFLDDKTLGVQVLLLVRDPRGTMQSRHHRDWCPGNPDCDDPAKLCSDLVSDYNTALDFRRRFPHSFRVVRYEDLSFEAYNMTKELFNFFHLSYHPRVQTFLDTHTKESIGGVSSTFRNSKTAPVHWQKDLSWVEVESIQRVCSKALRLWGYEIATNEDHLRSFKPVGLFRFR